MRIEVELTMERKRGSVILFAFSVKFYGAAILRTAIELRDKTRIAFENNKIQLNILLC